MEPWERERNQATVNDSGTHDHEPGSSLLHRPGGVRTSGHDGADGSEGSNDHLALIYEERDEQFAAVVPFIREGLERGERCLYVADDNTRAEVLGALREGGIDTESARDSGALSVRTREETYLRNGGFDREAMMEFWRKFLERTREDEFGGIRAAAEMTWALDGRAEFDDLVEYEVLFNTLYAGEDYTVLCQYNRDRFPPEVISDVVRSHPLLVRDDATHRNSRYAPPDEWLDAEGPQSVDGRTETGPDATGAPDATTGPVRVLYVDDEPGYSETVAEFLELDAGIDTVVPESDPQRALDRLGKGSFDCVVSDYDMPGLDGLELLDAVRERYPALPFILVTGKGDEGIASEAISAGVTDYLRKRDGTEQYTVLAHRASNAVEQHRTDREIERTQRQYTRLIEESTDVIAVLDAGGKFKYLSPAAERRLGYPAAELVGENGIEYVHPEDREAVIEGFAALMDRSRDRRSAEFRFEQPDGSWIWLESRARNALDDPDIGGVIVYARDVTERKKRERALRESEQRFRSLFEEAFDAMVIADDDGEYVDANPAACELFGLSREELLGRSIVEFAHDDDDVEAAWRRFRDADLERGTFPLVGAEGTECIVEYATTPNIVPGRHLSVLRDVTDREQHERTLTALHDSSRDLLGAESRAEVAESVVRTATDVLAMSAVVYLFDPAEGTLYPEAVSSEIIDRGAIDALPLERDDPVASTFLDGEARRIGDGDEAGDSPFSDLPLCGGLLFPLGDHGVCVVGDTESDVTDADREFAEILTAAAETALDRVASENELRKQRSELQAQNRKLGRLNRLEETLREIDEVLLQADTRDEIETAVCELLSGCSGIAAVWIGEHDHQHRGLVPSEWHGDNGIRQYLDTVSLAHDDAEPTVRVAEAGEPVHEENIADDVHGEAWRGAALSNGFRSVFSVPLAYRRTAYGTVTLYAERGDVFDELSRNVLLELSNKVANAINSVRLQNAVLSEAVTEVTVRFGDECLPLYRIASRADCSLALETVTQRSEGTVAKQVSIEGVAPERVADVAAGMTAVSDASTVTDDGREGTVELVFSGRTLTDYLADRGIRVPEFTADPDSATVTVLIPDTMDLGRVFAELRQRYSDPELVAKNRRGRTDTPAGQPAAEAYRSRLTPRQQEVLRTAYASGFFRSPRECTGEDLADDLDISPQTVYRHIRAAERKLFETVFDGGSE